MDLLSADLSTVVEVEEPRYTAVALLPRGRYQFSVRQMRGSVMSGAVSVDVKLTENIRESICMKSINCPPSRHVCTLMKFYSVQ